MIVLGGALPIHNSKMVLLRCLVLLSFVLCNTNAIHYDSKENRRLETNGPQWIPVYNPIEQGGGGKGKGATKMIWSKSPIVIPSIVTFAPIAAPIVPTPVPVDASSNDFSPISTMVPTIPTLSNNKIGLQSLTNSPTATTPFLFSPPSTMAPTLPRLTRVERLEHGRLVHWHACPLPDAASPVATVRVEFVYTMTVTPGAYHALQIPALEAAMNEALARNVYLHTSCTYRDDETTTTPFLVRAIGSAPYDHVMVDSVCGPDCRRIQGGLTLETFHLPRQRRHLQRMDQWVQQDVARTLQTLLPTLTVMDITQLEFIGLAGAGGHVHEPVVDATPPAEDTAAAVQQSPSAQAPVRVSWGAAIVAVAAAVLVLTVAGSMRRRQGPVLQQPWQDDRYTYEVDDDDDEDIRPDEQYVHDILVDHQEQELASGGSGGMSTLSPASSSGTPIVFLPVVQRHYQSPDTLDL